MTVKKPKYAEHNLPEHAARLSDDVLAGADGYRTKADRDREAKRRKDWTPPEGHTTRLPDAIVEQGDVLVVDESLPADGIVEPREPDMTDVMTAGTVYAAFAQPEPDDDAEGEQADAADDEGGAEA